MVEEIPALTGKMGHFYLKFYTLPFCRAVNLLKLIHALSIHIFYVLNTQKQKKSYIRTIIIVFGIDFFV